MVESWQWKTTNDRPLCAKLRPCKIMGFVLQHCRIKNILTSSIFLLFLEIKKGIFCPFQDFQGPRRKFKDFPGPGNFFHQFQGFPRFSRTVATLTKDQNSLIYKSSLEYTGSSRNDSMYCTRNLAWILFVIFQTCLSFRSPLSLEIQIPLVTNHAITYSMETKKHQIYDSTELLGKGEYQRLFFNRKLKEHKN